MEDHMREKLEDWADQFSTEEEFVDVLPATVQGVIEILLETAESKGFLTVNVFRQLVMYFQYSCCHFATDVLSLNKEDYIRMCEISFDAFVNLTATHETSDRRDH